MGKLRATAEAATIPKDQCVVVRRVLAVWDNLDDEDREFLANALTHTSEVSGPALVAGLAEVGVKVNRGRIMEHRRAQCSCKEPAPWVN